MLNKEEGFICKDCDRRRDKNEGIQSSEENKSQNIIANWDNKKNSYVS